MQFEEYALRLNASDFASRSKAKAKPQRRESASSSTRTIPIGERIWTDVEPGDYSISYYEVSKKLIHLLRHESLHRKTDGAIEFWRIKDNLQEHVLYCHHWSDDKWKKNMARGGGNKKIYQYWQSCTSELFKVIRESKTIFKNMSCIVIIGLTTSGRKTWQEAEETRKYTSIGNLVPPSSSRSLRT